VPAAPGPADLSESSGGPGVLDDLAHGIAKRREVHTAYCASYPRPPVAVTLDIDDTVDVVHGHQQLSLFNAHYDERCFLPIHVYETATSRPVAVLLRPGKTPSGADRAAVKKPGRLSGPQCWIAWAATDAPAQTAAKELSQATQNCARKSCCRFAIRAGPTYRTESEVPLRPLIAADANQKTADASPSPDAQRHWVCSW
jgi:hypothetical protein